MERAGEITGIFFIFANDWRTPGNHIIQLHGLDSWRCVGLHLSEDSRCVWYDSAYGWEFLRTPEQLPDMERWIMARVLDGEVGAEREHPCIRTTLGGKRRKTPETAPRGEPDRYAACDVPKKRMNPASPADTIFAISNGEGPESITESASTTPDSRYGHDPSSDEGSEMSPGESDVGVRDVRNSAHHERTSRF